MAGIPNIHSVTTAATHQPLEQIQVFSLLRGENVMFFLLNCRWTFSPLVPLNDMSKMCAGRLTGSQSTRKCHSQCAPFKFRLYLHLAEWSLGFAGVMLFVMPHASRYLTSLFRKRPTLDFLRGVPSEVE